MMGIIPQLNVPSQKEGVGVSKYACGAFKKPLSTQFKES
jgi:hypothetical protein